MLVIVRAGWPVRGRVGERQLDDRKWHGTEPPEAIGIPWPRPFLTIRRGDGPPVRPECRFRGSGWYGCGTPGRRCLRCRPSTPSPRGSGHLRPEIVLDGRFTPPER